MNFDCQFNKTATWQLNLSLVSNLLSMLSNTCMVLFWQWMLLTVSQWLLCTFKIWTKLEDGLRTCAQFLESKTTDDWKPEMEGKPLPGHSLSVNHQATYPSVKLPRLLHKGLCAQEPRAHHGKGSSSAAGEAQWWTWKSLQWDRVRFVGRGVSKRAGSNPVHGPSVGWASLLGVTVS